MRSSSANSLLHTDLLLAVRSMYGALHLQGVPVQSALAIVPYEDMAYSVVEHASEMVMLPWLTVIGGADVEREPVTVDSLCQVPSVD